MTLADIKDIATVSFYIASLILAVIGFNKWRNELRGKSKYELSKNLLVFTYKFRDAVLACQNPGMHSAEYADRQKGEKEKAEEGKIFDSWHAYMKRYEKVREAESQLVLYGHEAEAVCGADAKVIVDRICENSSALFSAIMRVHRHRLRIARGQRVSDEAERKNLHYENIIYGTDPTQAASDEPIDDFLQDNDFKKNLTVAVKNSEQFFKQYL